MQIPRFSNSEVSQRLLGTGVDDAFQRFVAEALKPRWPELHVFPAAGKDGGIDLSQTTDTRTVVECKVVGDDEVSKVEARWNEVAERLAKNLASADGPPSGQSQYEPWYRTEPPINEYLFCVSASLKNQARRDDATIGLRSTIATFFRDLAEKHPHLSHLRSLQVQVIDWDELTENLSSHLVFRWFAKTRINGLTPFGDDELSGSFRDYLHSEKLPYYSRSMHLNTVPGNPSDKVDDEDALLDKLKNPRCSGLIISGAGGVGKSRLMWELGHNARRNRGMTVLRVEGRLKPDTLEKLAEQLSPHDEVLILIDYIETQHDFIQFVEDLNTVNATYELQLRYIACCRASYFSAIQYGGAATSQFYHVNLASDSALEEWLHTYHVATILHILQSSGVQTSDRALAMCGQTPVFAVFLAWLHDNNRIEELTELLTEVDFGHWISKRVQKSFPSAHFPGFINQTLAQLVCLFPLSNDVALSLRKETTVDQLFSRLQQDRWIERSNSDSGDLDLWETAHDVLADQIVLSHGVQQGQATDHFVLRVLELAAEHDVVESALVTFQRVAGYPPFNTQNWEALLRRAIRPTAPAWRKARNRVIQSSLLSSAECVRLLDLTDLWDGAEAGPTKLVHFNQVQLQSANVLPKLNLRLPKRKARWAICSRTSRTRSSKR